ncbi:MAG: histone deacetylase [Phycisphaeraceae bacterium]
MDRYVYLHHASSLEHDTGAHPECAARIEAIECRLERDDWLGFDREQAPAVARETLEAVHPAPYVDSIESIARSGGGMLDMDTIASSGSFDAALHSAGAAVHAVDLLIERQAGVAFCALRPPGHHAEPAQSMGFCLFNNVAVAAQHALTQEGMERVLVLDWDVHHGNGTNDIFYGTDSVLYISIHQSPLYPGTGAVEDIGVGDGEGFTVNLPVPAGSGEATYLSLFAQVIAPIARLYRPQLLLVSAGYDAHRDDPLADCELTEESYGALASGMRALSDELDAPLGFVLEGGYDLNALSEAVATTMRGAQRPQAVISDGRDETVGTALEHHGRWWPDLA